LKAENIARPSKLPRRLPRIVKNIAAVLPPLFSHPPFGAALRAPKNHGVVLLVFRGALW
jgi:hypothetical protein